MIDWSKLYTLDKPILEIVLRGSLVYLFIFILLRVVLKRQSGNVGLSDMLLIVLIADASQNAMANEYRSLPAGMLLVGTLVFWNFALDWLGFRFRWLGNLLESPPLKLISGGNVEHENLSKEFITEDELQSQLRQKGYDGPSQVREGYIEGNGHFSFLPHAALAAMTNGYGDGRRSAEGQSRSDEEPHTASAARPAAMSDDQGAVEQFPTPPRNLPRT